MFPTLMKSQFLILPMHRMPRNRRRARHVGPLAYLVGAAIVAAYGISLGCLLFVFNS